MPAEWPSSGENMPIDDNQLGAVVRAWNAYAEERPGRIKARDLLDKRDINMYRGLGIAEAYDLAKNMVEHRSVATMEMTMGYLYERLLEELGPRKVTRAEKMKTGYRGNELRPCSCTGRYRRSWAASPT